VGAVIIGRLSLFGGRFPDWGPGFQRFYAVMIHGVG
jgi:hypothetical protein